MFNRGIKISKIPILYSFRRCPYAMRARMSILRSSFEYEHREVILRERPDHMMKISPKGTVPVMLLIDGTVIEESLEIMQYVLGWELTDNEKYWVKRNDDDFKFHLDRYKYPNRYEDVDYLYHRNEASKYLVELDKEISNEEISLALNDALFPFVRQFANHDRGWFESQNWSNLYLWLQKNLESEEFKICMTKHPQWVPE
tara:strand:+ start:100 stop:699 length:600 start_codon:yes stop_codon:yes gene_type:complete